MDNLLTLILAIALPIAVGVLIVMFAISRFYQRATPEVAIVRNGLGGEKVVLKGGVMVFPPFQSHTRINMMVVKILVDRRNENALYTKDLLKADATTEFHIRVARNENAVKEAAVLGNLTFDTRELSNLLEGKLNGAIRSVAAQMDLIDLHSKREDFNSEVRKAVTAEIEKNGFELESVQLTNLTQTSKEHFDPENSMDAEGLTKITKITEESRKTRNEIENSTKVLMKRNDVEATKEQLSISRDGELAAIEQKKELDEQRAKTASLTAITINQEEQKTREAEIQRDRVIEQATIQKELEIEQATIQKNRDIEQASINRDRDLELNRQENSIKLHERSEAEAAAAASAQKARALQVQETETVETIRLTEIAKREKHVAVIAAEKKAEEDSVGIRVKAAAEKAAAEDRAAASETATNAEVYRLNEIAKVTLTQLLAEAEGLEKKNNAENQLSEGAIALRVNLAKIEQLPKIIEATVEPLKNIDSIRILDAGGFTSNGSNGEGGSKALGGVDAIAEAALKYRASGQVVDEFMADIGIKGGLSGLLKSGGLADTVNAGMTSDKLPKNVG